MYVSNILRTDSYKLSHAPWQYPPDTSGMWSYLESRGGRYGETCFVGLHGLLQAYFTDPITMDDIIIAKSFAAMHGEPFNEAGWLRVLGNHQGRLPVRIRAVPEGMIVPTHNILLSVESTDPELYWLPSYIETQLVRLWYPITVATQSLYIKRNIWRYLKETSDAPAAELPFKLHDFGARGVSSAESAGIGGFAHLTQFQGSDTIEGILYAKEFYGAEMAGFSIPAAEHSTITVWGKERELDAYRNMVKQFGQPGKLFACVSDSYDILNAVERFWGEELRDEVKASGATLVIRPDSGDPTTVVLQVLEALERKVGAPPNLRGYKTLPKWVRIIQGDGVDEESIDAILFAMKQHGYSASNIAFGMGGALLQKLNRDTQRFAYKCSEATVGGKVVPVFKDPVTDPGKKSKAGRLSLVRRNGEFMTVPGEVPETFLETVYEDGKIVRTTTLDDIRKRVGREFL
jgi:nicotinamide phosphoribosyltransferase